MEQRDGEAMKRDPKPKLSLIMALLCVDNRVCGRIGILPREVLIERGFIPSDISDEDHKDFVVEAWGLVRDFERVW